MNIRFLVCVSFGLLIAEAALAQQYIFPKQGQSAQQQDQDEYYCHNWATKQTGYDPTRPASPQPQAQAQPGSGARGALRGAGRGWIISEITDGDSGKGAGIGAIVGGIRGRHQSRSQAQSSAAASADAHKQDYLRARAACLEAKGYTVK